MIAAADFDTVDDAIDAWHDHAREQQVEIDRLRAQVVLLSSAEPAPVRALARLQAGAAARLRVEDCRGHHPPEWSEARGLFVCARCRLSLDLRRRRRAM